MAIAVARNGEEAGKAVLEVRKRYSLAPTSSKAFQISSSFLAISRLYDSGLNISNPSYFKNIV